MFRSIPAYGDAALAFGLIGGRRPDHRRAHHEARRHAAALGGDRHNVVQVGQRREAVGPDRTGSPHARMRQCAANSGSAILVSAAGSGLLANLGHRHRHRHQRRRRPDRGPVLHGPGRRRRDGFRARPPTASMPIRFRIFATISGTEPRSGSAGSAAATSWWQRLSRTARRTAQESRT